MVVEWLTTLRRPAAKRYDKATFKASDCIYREPDCVYCENGLNELHRAADKRRTSDSVVAQNSLYSAMTLNGALVAMAAREDRPEFPVFESHPDCSCVQPKASEQHENIS